MEEEKKKYANELKEDIHQFLKWDNSFFLLTYECHCFIRYSFRTGDASLHSMILNKLCLSNAALSDISFEQISTLFSLLNAIDDATS